MYMYVRVRLCYEVLSTSTCILVLMFIQKVKNCGVTMSYFQLLM